MQGRKPTTQQAHKEGERKKGREAQQHPPPTKRGNATRDKGTRKGKGEREAHKPTKRGTPPLRQVKRRCFPHHKFAPKNQQKVAWGRFEKIFGKIFRGNVSGVKKNPLRYLNGRGDDCLINLVMKIVK